MVKRIKYTEPICYSSQEPLLCPYCGAVLPEPPAIPENKIQCNFCKQIMGYDHATQECLLPDGQLYKGELVQITGRHQFEIAGMSFEFKVLSDAIGEHPVWYNKEYTIFADLELDGEFGLFIDISHNTQLRECLCESYDEKITDFAQYMDLVRTKCLEILMATDNNLSRKTSS